MPRHQQWLLALLGVLCCAGTALGRPPIRLRIATVAPDGTGWARIARAFSSEVERATLGSLRVKWYFGGIAGDEDEELRRIQRGQLDGAAATVLCGNIAPTMRAIRVVGVIQNRDEDAYVLRQLRPQIMAEMRASGYEPLVIGGFGSSYVFSRNPIRSLSELKRAPLWVWTEEQELSSELRSLGLSVRSVEIADAAHAYDDGKLDGFVAAPTAALAFQWSARTRYLLNLPLGFLSGCLFVATRSIERLTIPEQEALRSAGAELASHLEALGREQDQALLGGLFTRQGLTLVQPSPELRDELFQATQAMRSHLPPKVRDVVSRVLAILGDYRAGAAL